MPVFVTKAKSASLLRLSLFLAVFFAGSAMALGAQASHKKNHYIFQFLNPFPFPVSIKVYGPSKYGFPDVSLTPAPPAPPIPIPYPNINMVMRVKINGKWSPKFTIPWKPGPIILPGM